MRTFSAGGGSFLEVSQAVRRRRRRQRRIAFVTPDALNPFRVQFVNIAADRLSVEIRNT